MTDYAEFKTWCDQHMKALLSKLGIVLYEIRWGERLPTGESDSLFEIEAKYPYRHAWVKFSHVAYEKWLKDPESLKSDLLHEVFHIILAPLSNAAYERHATGEMISNAEEEVTDTLTAAFENLSAH